MLQNVVLVLMNDLQKIKSTLLKCKCWYSERTLLKVLFLRIASYHDYVHVHMYIIHHTGINPKSQTYICVIRSDFALHFFNFLNLMDSLLTSRKYSDNLFFLSKYCHF